MTLASVAFFAYLMKSDLNDLLPNRLYIPFPLKILPVVRALQIEGDEMRVALPHFLEQSGLAHLPRTP